LWAFPIHRYPAEMARRHGVRTAMFDRREQLVCSRCGSWVRYDCQWDPSGHDRWWPSTREDAVGGVQPTSQEEAKPWQK
jgi:hypothetical protein